jgi:hypothetical protein
MNDDWNPELSGLRLLGIFGGLTPQPSVSQQPVATLIQWQALKTSTGAIHLVGYCTERREGRASTAVVTVNAGSRHCMTASGRVYVLSGPPGRNSDAAWVWEQYAAASGVTDATDVSGEVAAEFARSEPRP